LSACRGGALSHHPTLSVGTASGAEALQNFPAPAKTYANAWRPVSIGSVLLRPGGTETSRYIGCAAIPSAGLFCNRPRLLPACRAVFLRLSSLGAEPYTAESAASARDARWDSPARHSGATAFLKLLAAPARAWLVPPDLLFGDGRRCPAKGFGQTRHLAERQPRAADVELSLLA
jgi:hypothetical protein